MASKPIHFLPILSVCLRKNFQYRFCISRENRGKSFVKIHMCFIAYIDCSHGYDFLCVLHILQLSSFIQKITVYERIPLSLLCFKKYIIVIHVYIYKMINHI